MPLNDSCVRQVIKIRILTHHGNEYYCTMSSVMVYGTTQWEEMGRALEENEQQVTIVKRVLDGVSSQEKEKGQDKPLNAADANATAAAASKTGAQYSYFTRTKVQKLTSPLCRRRKRHCSCRRFYSSACQRNGALCRGKCLLQSRCSVYLLFEYKSTKTDAAAVSTAAHANATVPSAATSASFNATAAAASKADNASKPSDMSQALNFSALRMLY